MDTELFELCKEVYKRTEWQIDDATWIVGDENGDLFILTKEIEEQGHFDYYTPLYTSDYLLDRLPSWTRLFKDYGEHPDAPEVSRDAHYRALYDTSDGKHFWLGADTPLKALLKLVIALDDAKEF